MAFVTKSRHKVFTDTHLTRMEETMRSVCADFECELVEFNGEDNHAHLLVNFPPKVAVTKLVNSLKVISSRRLRQKFPDLVRHYWRANKLCSGTYFAGTVGGAEPCTPACTGATPTPATPTYLPHSARNAPASAAKRASAGADAHPTRQLDQPDDLPCHDIR